jgi:hypothetical protein
MSMNNAIYGIYANMPPPGNPGATYVAYDKNAMYYDNGSAWVQLGASVPVWPADSNTKLWYKLDEVSLPYTNSGNADALNMTPLGAVSSTTGIYGKALSNQSDVWVQTTDTSLGESSAFTMSLWYKTTVTWPWAGDPWANILCKNWHSGGTWSSPWVSVQMQLNGTNNNGTVQFVVTYNGTGYGYTPATKLSTDAWAFLALTCNSGTNVGYIFTNGTMTTINCNTSGAPDWNQHGWWNIGGSLGYYDDVRIENVVRSKEYLASQYYHGIFSGVANGVI